MHLKTVKNLAVSAVVGTMAFSAHAAVTPIPLTAANSYKTTSSPQSSVALASPAPPATVAVKDSIDLWLDELALAESGGQDHARILDFNGYYSYGCLQFQLATFASYGQKYGIIPDGTSEKNLRGLMYDCSTQKQVARAMIEDNVENWRHWYNSVRHKNVGLPPVSDVFSDVGNLVVVRFPD